ncbi:MAG TPA: tetratricopeptide repeat-containing protein kinase family protein, partial [Gemmataceae bacterium]|nr:tetratricopeptide repeat-containing protein kinase family protein [Gemmataceae bacterium]
NVLVAEHDGRPVPKVIDFGLAKAIHQPLIEDTLHTAPGAILGTPPYMSPEQAELNNPDIDTRTDVYALGVILYELLTGTPPLEKARFRDGSWPEVLRLIREEEPPRPSTRLGGTATPPDVASRRNTEPARLTKLVRGELDWIVMKCLEKDRGRRYETASGLAVDLERYLGGEPVLAAPPGAAYRLRKFVRRNRGPVAAASSVFLVLVAGVVGTTVGLVWARQKEAETAAILAFVEEKVFPAGRPAGWDGGLGRDVKLIDVVRAALPSVSQSFQDQPLIEARLRMMFGGLFDYLGDIAAGATEYEAANRLRAANLGPDHPDTLLSATCLADDYAYLDRHREALTLRREILRIRRAKFGPEHPDTLTTMAGLAWDYDSLGHQEEALELKKEVLRVREARLAPGHPDTLNAMFDLAGSYCRFHRLQDAITLYESVLSVQERRLGPDDPVTLGTKFWLAEAYTAAKRHTEALALHLQVFERQEAIFGPDHHSTLQSLWGLADSLIHNGHGDDAAKLIDEGLRRTDRSPTHRQAQKILVFLDLRRLLARIGPAERRSWNAAWMTPDPANADSLYQSACFRSLLAAITSTDPKTPAADAPRLAKMEADRAMEYLRQAVTAGYRNVVHMEKDTDLDALRGRDDFKQMLTGLRLQSASAPAPLP